MKSTLFKLKLLILFLLIKPLALSASSMTSCCLSRTTVEVKAGYFFFSDSKMRKIYHKGGLDLQLCGSYSLYKPSCGWDLRVYGAVEYFHRTGKSTSGDQKTSLWSIPVNLGIMPVWAVSRNLQCYLALGPRYFFLHQHNDSSYVYKSKSKNGLGFFANAGLHYLISNGLYLDIFGEYSYARTRFHGSNPDIYTKRVQIGGYTFGGGLGYRF